MKSLVVGEEGADKAGKKFKVSFMMVGETHSFVQGAPRTNFTSAFPERCNVIDYSHSDESAGTPYFCYRTASGKLMDYETFRKQQRSRSDKR